MLAGDGGTPSGRARPRLRRHEDRRRGLRPAGKPPGLGHREHRDGLGRWPPPTAGGGPVREPVPPPGAPVPDGRRRRSVFDRGVRAARGLLATAAPGSELVAVGAATFGIPYEDRVELAPAIDGWESLALGRELRAAFGGAAIRMATDAKAAAAAEVTLGRPARLRPRRLPEPRHRPVGGDRGRRRGHRRRQRRGRRVRLQPAHRLRRRASSSAQRTMLEEMVSGLALARRASGQPGRPPGADRGRRLRGRAPATRRSAAWSTSSPTSSRSTW